MNDGNGSDGQDERSSSDRHRDAPCTVGSGRNDGVGYTLDQLRSGPVAMTLH